MQPSLIISKPNCPNYKAWVCSIQEVNIIEEWMTSDVHSVNQKVKDYNKIQSSPYKNPCISANDFIFLPTFVGFYSSPWLHKVQQKTCERHSSSLPLPIGNFSNRFPLLFTVLDIYNFGLGTIYRLAGQIFYHRYCCDMWQCDTKVKFGINHSVSSAKILVLTFFLLLLYTIVQGVSKTEIYLFIFIFCTIAQSF